MSEKLIRVGKGQVFGVHFPELRLGAQGITMETLRDHDDYRHRGEIYIVDDRDVERAVQILTSENPGKDVQVWDLIQVSVCPAAEMVTKKVSKDGVLPA